MQRSAQPLSSWLISTSFHAGLLLLLLLAAAAVDPPSILPPHITVMPLAPRITAPRLRQQDNGGGQSTPEPPRKGEVPPKPAHRIFLPPQVAVNEQPKLSLEIALMDTPALDISPGLIGDPLGLLGGGGGPGSGVGIGYGPGRGIGDGPGDGYGLRELPREKLTRSPEVIYKEEPQYSEPARRARIQGAVRVRVDVGIDGRPVNIRVVQSLGLGLDENAIEAVKHWRFRPALIGVRPVVAPALIEVAFHLL